MPDARVLRPATAELRFPARISLGAVWQGDGAASLQQSVRQKLAAAPARLVVVDPAAPVTLVCSVSAPAPQEQATSTETTCTDNSGASPVSYACFQVERHVEVSLVVSVTLFEPGRELFRISLPFKARDSTRASIAKERVSPGSAPAAPPIDVDKLRAGLLDGAASRLVKIVAPYTEPLGKARSSCGTTCEDAWKLVAACDYLGADAKFEEAAASVADPTQRSAALWGRAISHELLGKFDEARAFLQQGQALAPVHSEFAAELADLPERRAEAERLVKQGLACYTACSR